MPGFSIVEFINEKTVEVVPSNWILNDNICWWPASTGPKLHKQLTNPNSQPDFTKGMGILYSVKILKTFGKLVLGFEICFNMFEFQDTFLVLHVFFLFCLY